MKSLNRTLALVLVLVMVFGLFGVASASSSTFTDAASVGAAYAEAVDVLTGIGAVNGATATTLDPTGSYTREQAAKVIAYVSLGKTTAEALACSVAPFSDVAADRWSAGYIQYAVSQGIINGLGDGSFNPTGALTGYQFAKMLLCALGYGKAGEYTGTGWEIAVAKTALPLGIFKGDTTAATNATISRQQAMLMAFNAMFLNTATPTYQWDNGVRHVVAYTTTGASFAYSVYGYGDATHTSGRTFTSAANTSGLTKVTTTVNGASGYVWYYKSTSTAATGFYSDQTVIGSSTDGTALAAATGSSLTTYLTTNAKFIAKMTDTTISGASATLLVYVNGEAVTATSAPGSAGYWYDQTNHKVMYYDGTSSADVNGYGVEYTLVDTNTDTDTAEKLFVTTYKVDVVEAAPVVINNPANGKDYVFVNMGTDIGTSGGYTVKAADVTGYAGLVKGDVVLVYKTAAGTYKIVKPTSFVGAATAKTGTALTIGGTVYKAAAKASSTITNYAQGFLNNVTFYTDTYGYLVYAKAVTVPSTDYAYILLNGTYTSSAVTSATNQSYVVLKDGSTATITVASVDGNAFTGGAMATPTLGGVYSFVKNTDGTYALTTQTAVKSKAATTSADSDGAITKGVSLTTTTSPGVAISGDSTTIYVVRNIKTAGTNAIDYAVGVLATGTAASGVTYYTTAACTTAVTGLTVGTSDVSTYYVKTFATSGTTYYTTWSVYTGFTNMITATKASYTAINGTDGFADVVFVSNYSTSATTASSVIYLLSATATAVYKDATTVDYYTYPAIVDGAKTTVKATSSSTAALSVLGSALSDGTLCKATYNIDGKLSTGSLVPITATTLTNGHPLYSALTGNFVSGSSITAAANGVVKIGSVGYSYSATTVVFYISADHTTMTMGTVDGVADATATVVAVTAAAEVASASGTATDAQKNTLKAIFVQAN